MLDLGWSELLVVGAIAVVVVGPKEMPRVIRGVTNALSKVRNMTGEFRDTMNEIADTEDYEEILSEMKKNNAELAKNIEIANKRIAEIAEDDDDTVKPKKVKSKKTKANKSKSKSKKTKSKKSKK